MRSFILTIFFVALGGLSWSSATAQNPPPPAPVDAAPEACSEAASGKTKAKPVKASVTVSVAPARTQNPPQTPPSTVRPQVNPVPPVKPKIKIKVHNPDEDEDRDADEDEDPEQEEPVQTQQTVATTSTVIVSFCGGSSSVIVRGWDRNEVHASIDSGESVDLKSFSTGDAHSPASKIEVVINAGNVHRNPRNVMCQSIGDLRLDVPRGAALDLQTNEGDIDVADIARFRAQSNNGDITLRNITKSVDAKSFNGDVTVAKTQGSLNLKTTSGDIIVRDAASGDSGDGLDANSTSGEISLSNCTFGRVEAKSFTGELNWNGALANGGYYKFSTTNSEIMVVLPANSSFRVKAQSASQGAISTDFALRSQGETSFEKIFQSVQGVYGTGSAQLDLTTFNGTIRLRKK
jgi:DUF4097 and DUF4098 domain-containing protein YvlB